MSSTGAMPKQKRRSHHDDRPQAQRVRRPVGRHGFTIYLPTSPGRHNWFVYSQVRDDRECFGMVQAEYFGGYSHTMPIKPSAAFGSSMVVDGVPNPKDSIGRAELTVYEARKVARPSNTGPYISGWHQNYYDPARLASSYVKQVTS
jgi:hypothetical protein